MPNAGAETSALNCDFDEIPVKIRDNALKIPVARGSRLTCDFKAVLFEQLGELHNLFLAANAYRNMRKPRGKALARLVHALGSRHHLKPRAAIKGEEIGLQTCFGIVVFFAALCTEIFLEKLALPLQIRRVNRDMFNLHFVHQV